MIEQKYLAADVQGLFADALHHHQAGRLAEAEHLYRQILNVDPRHADTLHSLGVLAHQVGRNDVAVELIGAAIGITGETAPYHSTLGNVLKDLGRFDEAIAAYAAALRISPDFAEAHSNLGNTLQDLGRLDDAVAAYGAALRIKPDLAQAHYNRGIALKDLHRLDDAVASYRAALRIKPDFAEAHYNLGNVLRDLGRLDDAIAAYAAALAVKPDDPEAHYNRGIGLRDGGRLDDAVAAYDAVLHLKPDYPEAHYNRGNALQELGRLDDAVAAFAAALHIKPDYTEAHCNRGNALKDLGRLDDAIAAYDAALRINPDCAEAHYNRGNALYELGRRTEAIDAYAAALRVKPAFADAHSNLGIVLLLLGRFEDGWPEFEWRSRMQDFPSLRRDFRQPLWHGEDLAGKTILLHAEQGLGDTLQFCRYGPLVAARGGRVVLEVYRPLIRLLGGLKGITQIVGQGDALPPFDLQCPLMSLPRVFGTTVDRIPPPPSGLSVDPRRVDCWRAAVPPVGRRIGVVWQGSPRHKNDRRRSVPLACFAPLAGRPDIHLISLQKQHGLDQLTMLPEGMAVGSLGPDYADGDFAETAAVLAALDLVVTIDTAIAHLAGTMGRPVWLALPIIPDWRWMLGRDDTPWYPSMRLYRQSRGGDWSTVFERMAADLARSPESEGPSQRPGG